MGKARWKKQKRKRHAHPGASPGTLVIEPAAKKPVIKVISYDATRFEERSFQRVSELEPLLRDPALTHWIDVRGLGDEAMLRDVGALFGIHPLSLEDCVHSQQRPKIENYETHLFIMARMVMLRAAHDMEADQVGMFLGRNYVLTLQDDTPDCFDPVRARLKRPTGQHRKAGADYLCYSLLDAIVDNYFPVLETFGEYLETLEEETVTRPHPGTLTAIHCAKRELLDMRRVLWPQRDMLVGLLREETALVTPSTRVYLRDCLDHSVHVMDMIESFREITSGLHDVYLSAVGQRTNEIMKVLTIISTIFIPLTFIAGVYGMNFNTEKSPWNMPELNLYYGYPVTMAVMFVIGLGLVYYFVRKGWIFSSARSEVGLPPQALAPGKENDKPK